MGSLLSHVLNLAVLTKPDRIPAGEEHSWLLLLRNQRERHKYGWHCVEQPSGEQVSSGMTWSEARAAEIEFFDEGNPWSSLDALVRSRLGTVPLTKALGEALFALIVKRSVNTEFGNRSVTKACKRLPELLGEVDTNLVSCKKGLASSAFQLRKSGVCWVISSKMSIISLLGARTMVGMDSCRRSVKRGRISAKPSFKARLDSNLTRSLAVDPNPTEQDKTRPTVLNQRSTRVGQSSILTR